MINFDFLVLKSFLNENIDFLIGARFQKIQQPTRQDFVFGLRNHGEGRKLYVNINPNFFHLCFMSKENEQRRLIEIPKAPPMFCMLLRKYLEGAKIAKVEQPEGERILEFYFETQNELSEKIYLCLAIELMGKHSNIILYNYDTNVIIGCAHNVGEDKSRERHLMGGLPYVYPPKFNNNKSYFGLSSLFAEAPNVGKISISQMLDDYFASRQEAEKIKSIKSKFLSVVGAKLKKIKNSLDKIQKQNENSDRGDSYRKKGDLIMANLFHNKDFSPSIDVLDYETNSHIKIELDETKTLKENANRLYKLYTKSKTTALKSQEMIDGLQLEKNYLGQVLYSVESAVGMGDLLEIEEEIVSNIKESNKSCHAEFISASIQRANAGKILKRVQDDVRRGQSLHHSLLLTFHFSPFTVYVGKNNKQNDYIVSKLARDEDLWFHTRLCAGSHVLLKVENGVEPDERIIFECAKLAKEYSSAKNSSKVGIIYTKRKFLKKPPAAPLGYVIYKNEKEIIVD